MSTNSNSTSLSTCKVRCGNCGWQGTIADTVGIYTTDPCYPESTLLEIGCPSCCSDSLLED